MDIILSRTCIAPSSIVNLFYKEEAFKSLLFFYGLLILEEAEICLDTRKPD